MKKLTIAYFGTPYFSARFLEKLLEDKDIPIEVKFVVTRRDKAVGRKQIITSSPVKQIASKYKITVIEDLKMLNASNHMLRELDFAFLFAYGGLIPSNLIRQPKLGFLNTHPSLLPKYRGPSPMAYPLILGDTVTGVTFIKLDESVDHGPIVAQEKINIGPSELRSDLEIKLTDLSYDLFKKQINFLTSSQTNAFEFMEQNHNHATFTRKFTKEDGFIPLSTLQKCLKNEPLVFEELPKIIKEYIDGNSQLIGNCPAFCGIPMWREKLKIENSAKIIYDYFRGLYPWPGIWTLIKINGKEKRLKITKLSLQPTTYNLQLIRVQLEGKNEVDFKTFNKVFIIF